MPNPTWRSPKIVEYSNGTVWVPTREHNRWFSWYKNYIVVRSYQGETNGRYVHTTWSTTRQVATTHKTSGIVIFCKHSTKRWLSELSGGRIRTKTSIQFGVIPPSKLTQVHKIFQKHQPYPIPIASRCIRLKTENYVEEIWSSLWEPRRVCLVGCLLYKDMRIIYHQCI